MEHVMAKPDTARPDLARIQAEARACGIAIAAEREASILTGALYLHDAAQRLDHIAVEDQTPTGPDAR
jgi:hypothetical protein